MLLLIESFDNFGATLDAVPQPAGVVARKYPASTWESYMRVASGRLGGRALRMQGNWDGYISPAPLTNNSTLVAGFAFYCAGLPPASPAVMLSFYDGTTQGMNLKRETDGSVSVCRGSTTLATSDPILWAEQWHYIEFKVVCHDTTGSYDFRLSGATILSASGVDTKAGANEYHTTFRFHGAGTQTYKYVTIDDLYVLDGSGSVNNDLLGNMRVVAVRPDSAGDSTDWAPSAGANYTCVDEVTLNDDADYVEDSVSDQKDLYNYGSVSGLGVIHGVQACADCRETDATPFDLVTVCKSGVTESDDGGQTVGSTSYVTRMRILETDPDTSSAWTISGVNAAQFGVKVG